MKYFKSELIAFKDSSSIIACLIETKHHMRCYSHYHNSPAQIKFVAQRQTRPFPEETFWRIINLPRSISAPIANFNPPVIIISSRHSTKWNQTQNSDHQRHTMTGIYYCLKLKFAFKRTPPPPLSPPHQTCFVSIHLHINFCHQSVSRGFPRYFPAPPFTSLTGHFHRRRLGNLNFP